MGNNKSDYLCRITGGVVNYVALSSREEADFGKKKDRVRVRIKKLEGRLQKVGEDGEEVKKELEYAREEYKDVSQQFLSMNMNLAFFYAERFRKVYPDVPYEEIFSFCTDKLCRAWGSWDWRRGYKFSTYYVSALRRGIGKFIATYREAYLYSGVSEGEKSAEGKRFILSLDKNLRDSDKTFVDTIPDKKRSNVYVSLRAEELLAILNSFIDELSPDQQIVLRNRYGLNGDGEMTLEGVARVLCNERRDRGSEMRRIVGRERVRQIQEAGLLKLRELLESRGYTLENLL